MKGNFIYKRLGKCIQRRRKRSGFSQEKLALSSGVDRTFIGQIEVGRANPSFKTLNKIARVFKIKISTLLNGV